jgi:predicted RNase H-like nuclease (RuvC/YqgF family)
VEEVRKSRLFKNLSRRDQMELSKLSAQLKNMQEEMASLKELLEQLEELRATHHAKATATGIDATQLQTDRWYLTRIEEEAEMVQGRYDFMVAELAPLKAKILAVSYHKNVQKRRPRNLLCLRGKRNLIKIYPRCRPEMGQSVEYTRPTDNLA